MNHVVFFSLFLTSIANHILLQASKRERKMEHDVHEHMLSHHVCRKYEKKLREEQMKEGIHDFMLLFLKRYY